MPERTLVHEPDPCAGRDRVVATRVQRGETEEIIGRTDARGIRQTTGRKIGYIDPRTLKPGATQNRGDVGMALAFVATT